MAAASPIAMIAGMFGLQHDVIGDLFEVWPRALHPAAERPEPGLIGKNRT